MQSLCNPSTQSSLKMDDTFLDLLVDPGLLPVGVGLGLGDSGGARVASEKAPAFDATQHFVPLNALATEKNCRTTNVTIVLSDKCNARTALSHFRLHLAGTGHLRLPRSDIAKKYAVPNTEMK